MSFFDAKEEKNATILLTYNPNSKDTRFYLEFFDADPAINSKLFIECSILPPPHRTVSIIERRDLSIESKKEQLNHTKTISEIPDSHVYSITTCRAECLKYILSQQNGKPVDSDFLNIKLGQIGETDQLGWALQCLAEIDLIVDRSSIEPAKSFRCVMM